MEGGTRVRVLLDHLRPSTETETSALAAQPCASSSWSLPRFDVGAMESFLDEYRDLKAEVYGKLEQHPELLLPTLEGLSKGMWSESDTLNPAQLLWHRGAASALSLTCGWQLRCAALSARWGSIPADDEQLENWSKL